MGDRYNCWMSSSLQPVMAVPLEDEDGDDSEDMQIFEISSLRFELDDLPPKPETEDHRWTYVPALVGSQEVSGTYGESREMQLDETRPGPEVSKMEGVWQIEDHPWTCMWAPAGRQQDDIVIKDSDADYKLQKPKTETSDVDRKWRLLEAPPKPEAFEGLQEDLIYIMREFNLDISRTIQCLFFNSGEVGSTRHFLRTGLRPDGYPIWEPKDDADLKRKNPKLRARLVRKYGEENVTRRWSFLEG